MRFTFVLPRDAKIDEGKISVLTPMGTAMLFYFVFDPFEWHVPYGVQRGERLLSAGSGTKADSMRIFTTKRVVKWPFCVARTRHQKVKDIK